MFGAAACFACHRFGNEGGMTGPDLTGAGGRYNARDLIDQILNSLDAQKLETRCRTMFVDP